MRTWSGTVSMGRVTCGTYSPNTGFNCPTACSSTVQPTSRWTAGSSRAPSSTRTSISFAPFSPRGRSNEVPNVNVNLLIDAIVRQTTVLIAELATNRGLRAPLAHVAEQVFFELTRELDTQGISRKVSADM